MREMMIRDRLALENLEEEVLSSKATLSKNSIGRLKEEGACPWRTAFQRDRDRILHSKSFRRLKHKTQVFIAPEQDHYRTRLTHTLEVSQIARTLARTLCLNEDLTEAMALGHDLGHTPFGHSGEKILEEIHPGGFKHNQQSLRVVDFLEHSENRQGLNLTLEVRDGIVNHSGDHVAKTPEGKLIKYADRIAYINHDIEDAIRAGILKQEDLPKDTLKYLGATKSQRITTLIQGIVHYYSQTGQVGMDEKIYETMMELRQFMFRQVYLNPLAKGDEGKIRKVITDLYTYYLTEDLPEDHISLYKGRKDSRQDQVCDYIAGMTDRFAMQCWTDLFMPKHWKG